MQDSQILSTFQEATGASPPRPQPRAATALYDACHVGVALRALLFVELALAVAALYGPGSLREWGLRLALLTGAALPATIFWLLAACGLKKVLARWSERAQVAAGVSLRSGEANARAYPGATYLTATEFSDTQVWAQVYDSAAPGRQVAVSKTTPGRIRATRRSII